MNRQIKLTKSYTNSNFEEEVLSVQKKNSLLLSKLKGDLSIKSAYLFSNVTCELITLTNSLEIGLRKTNVTTSARIINKTVSATKVKSKSKRPLAARKKVSENIMTLFTFSINK